MNTGFINGFSVNGAAYPSWVIRVAVVAAVAAATHAVAPTRITFAGAYGDAVVNVTLSQTHTVHARASGTAQAQVSVAPTLKFAGASTANASSFGAGAVRRDVFASAGGDATASGEALTAQNIGSATASASSTVDATAHIIHPGRSVQLCTAQGQGTGDVTRYPVVLTGFGEVTYTRAEASLQLSSNAFKYLDGYVPAGFAISTASGEIPQDRVKIIATLGSFDFADSTATSRAFLVTPGRAISTCVITAQAVVATHIQRPSVNAVAEASASAHGARNVLPVASANADGVSYAPKARIKHATQGAGTAVATNVSASGLRTANGYTEVWAYGSNAKPIEFGVQYRATAAVSASATSNAAAKQRFAGHVIALAQAALGQAVGTPIKAARVNATLATATVGRAYAAANSEVRAPDDRYMLPSAEDRGMTVYAEERTMVVTA